MTAPNRRPPPGRYNCSSRQRYGIAAVVLFLTWVAYVHQNSNAYCMGGTRVCAVQGQYRALLSRKGFACAESDQAERLVEDSQQADASKAWHDDFLTYGASAPFKVFNSKQEANELAAEIQAEAGKYRELLDLSIINQAYGYMRSPSVMKLAHSPQLLARVQSLLGDDFILFESDIVVRRPGVVHRYHSDSSFIGCPPEDAVAVWVALRSVTCASTLEVLPFSHRLDITAQDYLAPLQKIAAVAAINMSIHANAAQRASELVTERFGRPGDPPITFVRMDVVDGEAIMFHPYAWHGSANVMDAEDAKEARLALAIRYMKSSCQPRIKNVSPPFTIYPQLPPVVHVHGAYPSDKQELLNLYTWRGSTVVPAGKTPFQLLEHRYTPMVSKAKRVTIDVAKTRNAATPLDERKAYVFRHPNVDDNVTKMTMYKTSPVVLSTERLASLEMQWTFQPQYGAPESAMGRHASEDLTVLLSGDLRFTHLIYDGTYTRETLVSTPGSLSMIDTMVWHKTTAMSDKGALYLAINYITRADLDGSMTTHAKDVSKLYDTSISELTSNGIVFPYPTSKKGGIVASGRSVHVTAVLLAAGDKKFKRVLGARGFDVLVVMLSGSLRVEGPSLGDQEADILSQYDVMLLPSDATITLLSDKGHSAEFEMFEFQGQGHGDSKRD